MALRGNTEYIKLCSSRTKDGKVHIELTPEYEYMKKAIHEMDYGGKRRKVIYEMLKSGVEFKVNGMHNIQTKNDPDILRLIKEGKIEMFNTGTVTKYSRCKSTYLRIKNG